MLIGLTAVSDRPLAAMYDDASGKPSLYPLATELSARVVLLGLNLNSHSLQKASPLARLIAELGCSWPSRTTRRPSSTESHVVASPEVPKSVALARRHAEPAEPAAVVGHVSV
jgi:hypothetical protein